MKNFTNAMVNELNTSSLAPLITLFNLIFLVLDLIVKIKIKFTYAANFIN